MGIHFFFLPAIHRYTKKEGGGSFNWSLLYFSYFTWYMLMHMKSDIHYLIYLKLIDLFIFFKNYSNV